jgi:type I restriction enzyme S subunit
MTDRASTVRLSDVALVIPGTSPSGRDINDRGEGLPFYQGAKEFGTRHPRPERFTTAPVKTAAVGDILLSVRAPVGRVNIADTDCAIGRGVMAVRPKDPADGLYISAFLQMMGEAWDAHATDGTMFANLSKMGLEQLPVRWPLMRHEIAEVLGALDDRMDAAARLTEILLNEAHAIYDVRAAGESAQVVRVGDIVSALDKGVSYKGAGLAEEGPWLVNLANFSAVGRFKREGTKHYTLPVRPQHRVSPGDLVIANTDLTQDRVILGQPALIPPGAQDAAVTHHVYAVRFAPEHAVYRLPLYFALRSQDFQDRSYLFGSGTTVAGLSRDAVLDYTCAMPPKGELPALTAELATRLEAVWRLEAEIDELRRTRDFLLPRLVSGELRVAVAEELVEAAT